MKYGILDIPNNRSMHTKPVIRGGGIIFYVAILAYWIFFQNLSIPFIVAISLIAIIGFLDDVISLSSRLRFIIQSSAVFLIALDLNMTEASIFVLLIAFILATGTLNAYNFMDGINGITGGYSLVVIGSLYYVNAYKIQFVHSALLVIIGVSLLIFNFFNFRKKAVCFAGDVGSLTIGFVIVYLIVKLILISHNYIFILFLAIYGVDSVLTIIHRLILHENIFKPHRLHLYQVLVSKIRLPHVVMSLIYMAIQILTGCIIIHNLNRSLHEQYVVGVGILLALVIGYTTVKIYLTSHRFSGNELH